ncbi:ribose-5-phosphate isomerase RpiA [Halarchaeum sp. P4]|uniref:ribose-5-phosphate isomerase RpiA n=1 Tax=Halarchaeum sp. P4 TaxID=3421639 RepID=UPI003EBFF5BE
MKQRGGSETAKRNAGEYAADYVDDGDVVGLGTGSTAAHAIRALGRRVDAGLDIRGVPTSFQSRELAREAGIPLTTLDDVGGVDVAIDGADQFDRETGALVKGGGAAHTREKLVDASAGRFVVVADPSKAAAELDHTVPVEVLPSARRPVATAVAEMGGDATLRSAKRKDGPVVTDNGNLVLDCAFGAIAEPPALATDLSTTPGVVEHGLFVGLADEVIVGTEDDVERYRYASE